MAHESLKAAYEEDAKRTEKPYLLWQVTETGKWLNLSAKPLWVPTFHYRRHPHADSMLLAQAYPHLEWEYRQSSGYWQDCVCAPLWDQTAEYRPKPNPLQALYEADKRKYTMWQYKSGNRWVNCLQPPDFYSKVEYRRHPHADLLLTYREGDEWEYSRDGYTWYKTSCPQWHSDNLYRKKPMTHELERKQYEADKATYNEPWKLWEYNYKGWKTLQHEPFWDSEAYRRKPEARPHAHLIKLWAEGHQIEKMNHRDHWVPCPNPCWESSGVYRQKPAVQTRFIPIFRMPAGSVYVGEGKISLADCNSSNHDTLISTLEITVDNANNVTLVKEHKCLMTSTNRPNS